MIRKWITFIWVSIFSVITGINCGQDINQQQVTAAELVKAVRESENWLHRIDSLFLRIESKWTRTPQGIAARRAQLRQQFPDRPLDPNRFSDLLPVSSETLEIAFDQNRLRYLHDDPTYWRQFKIWDGKEYKVHGKYYNHEQEAYVLDTEIQGHAQEMLSVNTAWPRAQAHSFWWDEKDAESWMKYYGLPEDFKIIGELNYRGVDCYVLDCNIPSIPARTNRWHVGKKDRLLYGLIYLSNKGKPRTEFWCTDYQEVAEDCRMPLTQGYFRYEQNSENKVYIPAYRDLKITEVRVNEELPDELFQMELTEGVEVQDRRSGELRSYIYQLPPPSLIGKPLAAFEDIKLDFDMTQASGKAILLCFWDLQQRPSRYCITKLAQKAQALSQKGVTVIAVQASKVDDKILKEFVSQNNIPFPIGMIEGDEEKTKFNWGVQALPWLILTDKDHIVRAEGFGVEELETLTHGIDNQRQLIERVIAGIENNENSIKNYKSNFVIEYYGSKHNPNDKPYKIKEEYSQIREGKKDKTNVIFHYSYAEMIVDGELYSIGGHGTDSNSDKPITRTDSVYDGKFSRIYRIYNNRGMVKSDPAKSAIDGLQRYTNLFPGMWDFTMSEFLKTCEKINIAETVIEKNKCFVFEAQPFLDTSAYFRITIDADRGYAFLKFEQINPRLSEKSHYVREVLEFREVKKGIFIPIEGKIELFDINSEDGSLQLDFGKTMRVRDIEVNIDLPADTFNYQFPNGAEIFDETLNKMYIVDDTVQEPRRLAGEALPDIKGLNLTLSDEQTKGKVLLLCFFDLSQRPSRHCMTELTKKAPELAKKNVVLVGVQASKVDDKILKEFVTQNNIPFPIGMIEGDEEKTKFNWGVQALPWLILTDKQHLVRAEGFGVEELEEKIKEVAKK